MQKNKLTMKDLQEQINKLQESGTQPIVDKAQPIVDKSQSTVGKSQPIVDKVQLVTGKSKKTIEGKATLTTLLKWFVITGIISYAVKLPFIGKWIPRLNKLYGKTTWWGLVGNLRKAFIILNALIGFYATLKIVGFNPNNIIGGVMAMGVQYLEIISLGFHGIFKWIYNLFEGIVPNSPSTPKFEDWSIGSKVNNPHPTGWSESFKTY